MSSCGAEPYRPRRSFSSPIISSLHVQPFSDTSRNAKSVASGRTSGPGVPHAARSVRRGMSFLTGASLKAQAEREEDRQVLFQLSAVHVLVNRIFEKELEIDRRLGTEGERGPGGHDLA